MNHLIIAGEISGISRQTGDKPSAEADLLIPPQRDGVDPITLYFKAWGVAAETLRDGPVILMGAVSVSQGVPSLAVSRVHLASSLDGVELNSICLVGRAGRDPEMRYFESGAAVANLSLAVNRRRRDEGPDWFDLKIWGKQAQVAADYVRKGSLLGIAGSFQVDFWTDRVTGEMRQKPVIHVDRLELLGSRRDAEGSREEGGGYAF